MATLSCTEQWSVKSVPCDLRCCFDPLLSLYLILFIIKRNQELERFLVILTVTTFIFCIFPFFLLLHFQFTVCVSISTFSLSLCVVWSSSVCADLACLNISRFLQKTCWIGLMKFNVWLTFTPGPQQLTGCPGAALGLFRGKESQGFNSSKQVFLWFNH